MRVMLLQRQAHVAGSERYLLSVLPAFVQRGIEASYLMIRRRNPMRRSKASWRNCAGAA